VTLLLGIPWLLFSLLVVTVAVSMPYPNNGTAVWTALGIFLGSGLLVFFRPTEDVIARVMFRLRKPTMHDGRALHAVWGNVADAAGVQPEKYRLWVQDSQGLNAFATSGHIVAVTRAALDMPPNHLAAVLAHELGHHFGGHPWATLLTYWYAIPGRLVAKAWFWISFRLFAIVAGIGLSAAGGAIGGRAGTQAAGCLIGPIVRLFPIMWMMFLAWLFYSIHPALLLLFAIPFVLAWFSRYGEKYADRVAADLGYGQPLIEVLYGWMNAGHDSARKQQGWRASLYSSHPSCASRIQALEKRLYSRTQTGGRA
jgi:STE24 endopeptidase